MSVARTAKKAASNRPRTEEPPIERPPQPKRYKASKDELLQLYKRDAAHPPLRGARGQLYGLGLIGGFCHLYIGQEAVAVGLQSAMTVGKDSVITGYRDHGHMLAYGIDPKVIMAELTGREAGSPRARAGRCTCSASTTASTAGTASSARRCRSAPASRSSTNMPRTAGCA